MKDLRIRKGLTQDQFARRLGLTQERISQLEHGDINRLMIEHIKKMAKVFNLCPIEMFSILIEHECEFKCKLWEEGG